MSDEQYIDSGTAFMMIAVAVLFDLFSLLAAALIFVNPILSIMATATFLIWFTHIGISFLAARRLFAMAATCIVELTPLGAFPVWTAFVVFTIWSHNRSDATV